MKTRKVQFKLKKQVYTYDLVTMDTVEEAQRLLGAELLNVINLGNSVYARFQALGKDPFKKRKTKYRLDASKIDDVTLAKLRTLGALLP